jgi:CRISPR/Cas system-associated exonuclease Cas4 (RecB family)
VPKPHTWRGYFATRASAKTLVLKNSGLLPPKSSAISNSVASTKEGYPLKFPLVEKFLVSEDIGILGKPDFIFLENGKATIYDYKFGNNQEDLDKHKIQMFFYQLLVESVLKIEVGKLAIVGSANRIWEISRNSQELEKLKIDIPRVLEALKSNKVSALPSEPNCKFCSFKSVCEPFKNAKIESYPNRPMALSGEVIQVRIVDEQFQELSIRSFANPGGEELKVFGIPIGYSVKPGDSVFLSDHLDFMDAKLIGFSWNSRISIEG